jgi:hypothetical protein
MKAKAEQFSKIVTMVAAQRILRERTLFMKQELLKASGWKSKMEACPTPRHPGRKRQTWTTPDGTRTYWMFDMAWTRFANGIRTKTIDFDIQVIASVFGIKK